MNLTIFLSCVTDDFGMLRRRLANLTQRIKKRLVRHRDDFFHRGVKTLQKLVEEVQESDLIVHLIGAQSGWCIPAEQSAVFLEQQPEFEARFPKVARQAKQGLLTATQWEAWFGLFLLKRFCSFSLLTETLLFNVRVIC